MKSRKLIISIITILLYASVVETNAQELFYKLQPVKQIETSDTRDQQREAVCWSNAGTVFLESEMLRLGKEKVTISELGFVHSLYMKKAEVYLKTNDKLRIDPSGNAFDVIMLASEFGMVPQSEFMLPDPEMIGSREKEGEMNAIIRGTLQMVKEKEGGEFTELWQNMFSTSLLRYLGEPKRSFTYQRQMFTPKSFVENSGLNLEDYIVITSDPVAKPNTKIAIETASNWSKYEAFNVSQNQLVNILSAAVNQGYPALWYGLVSDEHLFADENMAIVPADKMPEIGPADEETIYEPVAEKQITQVLRTEKYQENLKGEQTYLMIEGMMRDQKENDYFTGKYVCKQGNVQLQLSGPFVLLNTVYILINKNCLPNEVKKDLKL